MTADTKRLENAEIGMTLGNCIAALMNKGQTATSACQWLAFGNAALGNRTPADVVASVQDGFQKVANAIDSL